MGTKRCSTCKLDKDKSLFNRKSKNKDGLNCQCKDCQSAYFKGFYAQNADAQRLRAKEYTKANPLSDEDRAIKSRKDKEYREKNKGEISLRRKLRYAESPEAREKNISRATAWYEKNKKEQGEKAKAYYKDNADRIKYRVREYEKSNPERTRAYGRVKTGRRRAKLRTSGKQYTVNDVSRLLKLQRELCAFCGTSISSGYHVDHIVPVAKGGDNSPSNIQLLCPRCNLKKAAKLPHEFAQENGKLL